MRCKIRTLWTDAGDYAYISYIPVYANPPEKGSKRKIKFRPTPDDVKKVNRRNSQLKFEQTVHANFDNTSYIFDLSYKPEYLPGTEKKAGADIQNCIRRLRRIYEKAGAELKYVYVTQYGEMSGRQHHHMIISGGVPHGELLKSWGLGRVDIEPLQFLEKGVADRTVYMGAGDDDPDQQTLLPEIWKKRWCGSKNLKKPEKREVHDRDNIVRQKDVAAIVENYYERGLVTAPCRKEIEERHAGYTLCDIEVSRSEITRGTYVHIKMYRTGTPLLAWMDNPVARARIKGRRE